MIVAYRSSGRLGNRLATAAYYLALARELGEPFLNPALWRYRRHFTLPAFSPGITRGLCWLDRKLGKAGANLLTKFAPDSVMAKLRFDGDIVAEPSALISRALAGVLDRRSGPSDVNSEDIHITRLIPPRSERRSRVWFETGNNPGAENPEVTMVWKHREHIRTHFQLIPPLAARLKEWERSVRVNS